MKRYLTGVAVAATALVVGVLWVASSPADSQAYNNTNNCVPTRYACNFAETNARVACTNDTTTGSRRGAIWINTAGNNSGNRSGGYYNTEVRVSGNQNSVRVNIRGSVYGCQSPNTGATYATNIRFEGNHASRFTNLNSEILFRGNSSGQNRWSTQGQTVTVDLDVSDLARNNINRVDRETINVNVFRCFNTAPSNISEGNNPSCYPETVRVEVVREPRRAQWQAIPSTQVQGGSSPGDTVTWRHGIRNAGPENTDRTITIRGVNRGYLGTGTVQTWNRGSGLQPSAQVRSGEWRNTTRQITQNDVGNDLCRRTIIQPRAHNNTGARESGDACRFVPYRYQLRPTVQQLAFRTIPAGADDFEVRGTIAHVSGATKSDTNIQWRVSQLVFPPGANPNTDQYTGGQPCTNPRHAAASDCAELSRGGIGANTHISPGGQNTTSARGTTQFEDWEVGTTICFSVSVNRYQHQGNGRAAGSSQGAGEWRHSAMECAIVSKTPSTQVHGGALQVGRTFTGSPAGGQDSEIRGRLTNNETGTYGSWGEYGLLAPGTISGVGSGSGLNAGVDNNTSPSNWSRLTYANTPSSGQYTYTNSQMPSIIEQFTPAQNADVSGNVSLDQLRGGLPGRVARGTGNINLSGGTLEAGQFAVLRAEEHNVRITEDIRYTSEQIADSDQLPQLIIIANNIDIDESVTQVDAWLVARNAISTCRLSSGPATASWLSTGDNYNNNGARLHAEQCDEQLRVNGPVMTDKLYLRRTAGAGAGNAAGDPAEIFNLRADAYMWLHARTGSDAGVIRTTATFELPPRY